MKTSLQSLVGVTVLTLLAVSSAQAERGKFYIKGDVGLAITSDTDLEEFFGEPLLPNSEIEFDPGFHLGIRGGYGVTDWFDAELETGFTINSIDSITGANDVDAGLGNYPLLLNARFHCPALHAVSPYFGGGVGFATTVLWADDLQIGNTFLDGSTAGIAFAYQAFAGVRVAINERMGISVEYHFFGTTSTDMDVDVTSGTLSDELSIGSMSSHIVSVAFDYRF